MNEHHYKFARRMGDTPLRPDYANAIEHYRNPISESSGFIYTLIALLVIGFSFIFMI